MVRVSLTPDPNLRPGAFARAEVTVSNAERIVLPQTAVLTDDKGSYVLIIDSTNKIERRAVHVAGIVRCGRDDRPGSERQGSSGRDRRRVSAGRRDRESGVARDATKDGDERLVKNISAWAIRHPITPVVLFVVLFFLGVVAFVRLPINLNPDISFPLVECQDPAARRLAHRDGDADRAESRGLDREHRQRAQHHHVHHRRRGQHLLEFQIGTPIDRAVTDVRDAVAKVRNDLPQGIMEPLVQRENVDGGAISYYAVTTTSLTPEELSWFIDNTVTKRLLAVPGVAQVSRSGGVDREIRVELDPARLQALGLTAVEVNEQLRALNLDAAGGRAQVGGGEQSIRVLGGAKSAEDLADTQIIARGGRSFRLREIADVHDGIAEVRSIARLNGRPATAFGVFKAKGASDVSVSRAVEAELAKIRTENPDVQMTLVSTTVDHTLRTYESSLSALIEGSILAVAVVWLFLRSWRATVISALAIPLSAIPTFAFMQWMDFTLNQITLLGALAGGGRAGGRCHRRDREHRAAHAHGQERLPGRARCRR